MSGIHLTQDLKEWCLEEHGEDLDSYGRWEVCPACQGRGIMTLGRMAIPAEDFAEDPDFFDDYRSGVYDEPCDNCHGRTTIWTLDPTSIDPQLLKAIESYQREMNDLYQMERMERMMGA